MKKNKILPDVFNDLNLTLRLKHSNEHEYFYSNCESYWEYYSFDIVLQNFHSDNEDIVIGNLETRRFLSSKASIDNFCSHCAFDLSDHHIQQYFDILWDHNTHDLSSKFRNSLNQDCVYGDIFLVMSVDIKPLYRGYNFGNAALWIFYRNFCTVFDVIVLLAFPLQFSLAAEEKEKCKENEFMGTHEECTAKLIKYYKKLGFKRIGRSDFMLFNCENIMNKPKILKKI